MATTQDTMDYILEQAAAAGELRARKMFGEYALYCDDKVVAFVCDDQLFMKITDISGQYLDSSHEAPAYPGSKNYLCVPGDKFEDREWLSNFVRATADSLPLPKPKKPKKR